MPHSIVPVILAGGEGRRLRPLTAPTRPKPFLKLFSNSSLLQMTLQRAAAFERPVIVCDANFARDAAQEARVIGISPQLIVAEPAQRGTAAAIACAAFVLQQDNPLMLVMPSDHVIVDMKVFEETVLRAAEMVEDAPVIFGKRPDNASARYGYIRVREEHQLDSFVEKPSVKIARRMMVEGNVFWNTGIFLCRARTLLELLSTHAPEVFERTAEALGLASSGDGILQPEARRYSTIPHLSIDHAVMEKLHTGVVLPLETGWHDVGCWERIFALKIREFAGLRPARDDEQERRSIKSRQFR